MKYSQYNEQEIILTFFKKTVKTLLRYKYKQEDVNLFFIRS
jgi:hypothetical protein